jgi:hypothetical protein
MVNVDFLFTCSDQKCKKLLRIRNKEHFALVYSSHRYSIQFTPCPSRINKFGLFLWQQALCMTLIISSLFSVSQLFMLYILS